MQCSKYDTPSWRYAGIETYAFSECSSLKYIGLPASLDEIQHWYSTPTHDTGFLGCSACVHQQHLFDNAFDHA